MIISVNITVRDSPKLAFFFKCNCTFRLHLSELSDVQYTAPRRTIIKKNRYGEIALCASNPRCITMNAARVVRLFRVTRFMNANIPRIKSHARSLHHSPFSFLFRAPFRTALHHAFVLPYVISFLMALLPLVIGRTSTLDVS